jgi:hypothetical protein
MKLRTKIFISLLILAVLDMVIPIPFAAILLLYVVLDKPPWFRRMVEDVYET